MRLATMTVELSGFRTLQANPKRIELGRQILTWCGEQGVEVVFFPAGFLRSPTKKSNDAIAVAKALTDQAKRSKVGIVVGVDLCTDAEINKTEDLSGKIKRGDLPMGLVAWAPGMKQPVFWRQRSTTSTNHRGARGTACAEVRQVPTSDGAMAVLACGEAFNPRIRTATVDALGDGVAAVAGVVHTSAGSRIHNSLEFFASEGLPAFVSCHTAGGDGMKQARFPGRTLKNPAVYGHTKKFEDGLYGEVVVWEGSGGKWKAIGPSK